MTMTQFASLMLGGFAGVLVGCFIFFLPSRRPADSRRYRHDRDMVTYLRGRTDRGAVLIRNRIRESWPPGYIHGLDWTFERVPSESDEIVHACPNPGSSMTPCCGRLAFELPHTDRMTLDPERVTCTGADTFTDPKPWLYANGMRSAHKLAQTRPAWMPRTEAEYRAAESEDTES